MKTVMVEAVIVGMATLSYISCPCFLRIESNTLERDEVSRVHIQWSDVGGIIPIGTANKFRGYGILERLKVLVEEFVDRGLQVPEITNPLYPEWTRDCREKLRM